MTVMDSFPVFPSNDAFPAGDTLFSPVTAAVLRIGSFRRGLMAGRAKQGSGRRKERAQQNLGILVAQTQGTWVRIRQGNAGRSL